MQQYDPFISRDASENQKLKKKKQRNKERGIPSCGSLRD